MSPPHDASPPAMAEALLASCLPPGAVREGVLGDLHEAFLDRVESDASSQARLRRALLWYWGQVLALGFQYAVRRRLDFIGSRNRMSSLPRHAFNKIPRDSRMNNIGGDIRFAFRMLVRNPGFTLASVLVLAAGIGAVTVMFSVLNSVVLRPLPFQEPDRLVWVWGRSDGIPANSVSAVDYWDYRDQVDAFESLGAVLLFTPRAIITGDDRAERVLSTRISYNFLSVLGVSPQLGRSFVLEEEGTDAANVVVISDGFWRRQFGSDDGVVGTSVTINGQPHEVVGVLPAAFDFRGGIELWFPMQRDGEYTRGRGNNNFNIVGRLGAGVSIGQAQVQVDQVAQRLAETYPETNDGWGLRLEPLHEVFVGSARSSLLIMLALVGLVLLIACANVASLSLARAITRSTEVALRLSLGAGRARVVSHLLTESVLIALLGGGAGLVLAQLGISAMKSIGPSNLPRLESIGIDGTVLVFALAVSLIACLVFGIAPALRGTSLSLSETLKVGGGRGSSSGRAGIRTALVVGQVALSLMLLSASGLLVRSYLRLQRVDTGFNTERLLLAEIQLPAWRYETPEEIERIWSSLHARMRSLPRVTAVGAIDQVPIRGGGTYNTVYPAGAAPTNAAERAQYAAERRFASDDYFEALEIPILAGRALEPGDRLGSPRVMVISNTMAQQYFPTESPLGKELVLWDRNFEVVGVAGDVREFGLSRDFPRLFYLPSRQATPREMQLLMRTTGDPLELATAVRQAVWEIDNQIPVSAFETMESRINGSLAQPRFRMVLVVLAAAMALMLASVGLYGVLAFFVRQRANELGIRVALGARAGNIVALVVRRGMTMVVLGISIGLIGGIASARVMRSLLFDVRSADLMAFGGASLCLLAVAIIACVVPGLRAVRVDPQEVLRMD